jgi:D-glycero-D-manno-heptose 1,7-bisphosphate phosphatase
MKLIVIPREKTIIEVPDEVRPALCLDLDGTVRYSKNGEFINRPEDIDLFDGVEEKIWQYRDDGYLIFGITNQGGVAFGYKTPAGCEAEIEATCNLFERNPFHIIKSSYHHPKGTVEPYNYRSLLRKPDIGMLALCEVDAWQAGYVVDWDRSLFVGDRPEDQECAEWAGIEFRWAGEFFGRE